MGLSLDATGVSAATCMCALLWATKSALGQGCIMTGPWLQLLGCSAKEGSSGGSRRPSPNPGPSWEAGVHVLGPAAPDGTGAAAQPRGNNAWLTKPPLCGRFPPSLACCDKDLGSLVTAGAVRLSGQS